MKRILFLQVAAAVIFAACSGPGTSQTTTHTDTAGTIAAPAAGNCNDAEARKKMQDALSMGSVIDMSEAEVKDWLAAKEKPMQGLQSYEVDTLYDEHCILSARVHFEWMGAYPSQSWLYMNFDKHTGDSLLPVTFIEPAKTYELLSILNKRLKDRVAEGRDRLTATEELEGYDAMIDQNKQEFTAEQLKAYYLQDDHIVFVYPFDFPHVVLALQPEDTFGFKMKDFRPYIRKDGPLNFWLE